MKQKISALLLAALYLFILSGCKEAGAAPPPAALCAQIAGAVSFEAPLTEADAETACALYGLSAGDAEAAAWISSGGYADECAVFTPQGAGAETIRAKITARRDALLADYAAYRPAEVPTLQGMVLIEGRGRIVVCFSADPQAREKINALFSEEPAPESSGEG